MIKQFSASFLSGIGKHSVKSFGKDIGLDKIYRVVKNDGTRAEFFKSANNLYENAETASNFLKIGGKIVSSLIDNGHNAPLNDKHTRLPLTSKCECIRDNNSNFFKTTVDTGKPSSESIKKIKNGPFMEVNTKIISSTIADYQDHEKRKNLRLKAGFNQKGHYFLMEDTYFRVKDYLKLFKVEQRFKEEFALKHKGSKQVYGCALNTKVVLTLKSRVEFYDLKVKIHLVKIFDINSDVRELVKEFTNNSERTSYLSSGTIPKDEQIGEPIFRKRNKSILSFITLPNTNVKSLGNFKNKATVVRHWQKTLSPGSTWQFDFTHHLGNGIDLNNMWDMANKEHPAGYVFYIETLGDKRASVKRIIDGDVFNGFGISDLMMEFKKEITYITNQNNEEELAVKKISKSETDFEEDGEFFGIFHQDRENTFNIAYEDIIDGKSGKKDYVLEQDQFNISGIEIQSLFKNIKKEFTNSGLNEEDATEDDVRLNLKKEADESESPENEKFQFLRGSNEPNQEGDIINE